MVCKSSLFLRGLLHKNIKGKMRIYVTIIYIHKNNWNCLIFISIIIVDSILKLFKPISGFKFGNSSFYYSEKKVDSLFQCGLECIDSEYCSSFSYNHDSRTCLISSLFINSISALVTDPHFTHFQYKSSGSCNLN